MYDFKNLNDFKYYKVVIELIFSRSLFNFEFLKFNFEFLKCYFFY